MSIMNVLLSIKSDIDQKVYDRNDILKKDAYFERTVMTQIKAGGWTAWDRSSGSAGCHQRR